MHHLLFGGVEDNCLCMCVYEIHAYCIIIGLQGVLYMYPSVLTILALPWLAHDAQLLDMAALCCWRNTLAAGW